MPSYIQANRPLALSTPLGKDALLLVGFAGREGISQLFNFTLDLLAENRRDVSFDKLLGQPVTVELALPGGKSRCFNGICSRLSQGPRDNTFTTYRMEVVPKLWLLTRRAQCRIFQYLSVPDILKKVLEGLDVKYEIQGTFHPRDFCVQYRETDFAFASRLMEEEGIYYFFKHSASGHQMVVANTPASHPDLPEVSKAIYEEIQGGTRPDMRVHRWEKTQELRAGKYTLWDHCFELPQKHLEADRAIQESVTVGKVTHKLKVGGNDRLEIYDYPGGYAQRFDGIDKGGAPRSAELQKIFEDNKRTVAIRMEQEALPSLVIDGEGTCRQFTSGHKLTLERHYNADGQYVLTTVEHTANLSGNYRTGGSSELVYANKFTCIPLALPFRPPPETPQPVIHGTQTATVVGPPGDKIYCDKYGRVKVQFHWDRQGKKDADSSCWVRVSQNWGGANWGGMFIPHVGQEVIVSFEEGDPDRPLITGRVYNAECMPPLELPANKTKSAIRDHGGNEIIMEGDAGKQQMRLHSPTHNSNITLGQSITVYTESDSTETTEGNKKETTGGDSEETIRGKLTVKAGADVLEFFGGAKHDTVVGSRTELTFINKNESTVGLLSEYCGGIKVDIHQGKHFVHQPDEVQLTKARKLKKDAEELEKHNKLLEIISGVCDQKIATVNQKVKDLNWKVGNMNSKLEYTYWEVGNLFRAVAGKVNLQSNGVMELHAKSKFEVFSPDSFFTGDVTIDGSLYAAKKALAVKG